MMNCLAYELHLNKAIIKKKSFGKDCLFWPRWNSPILSRSFFFKNPGHNTINKYLKSLKTGMKTKKWPVTGTWDTIQGWVPWIFFLPSIHPRQGTGEACNLNHQSAWTKITARKDYLPWSKNQEKKTTEQKTFLTIPTALKQKINIQYSVHLTHSTHSMVLAAMSGEPILPPTQWIQMAMIC